MKKCDSDIEVWDSGKGRTGSVACRRRIRVARASPGEHNGRNGKNGGKPLSLRQWSSPISVQSRRPPSGAWQKTRKPPVFEEDVVDTARGAEERDPITLYLREIGQTKLLTREREILLAKRIKRGDARARQEMIKANLRLVVKIAREYQNYGVPLLDLISEGNIGLIKAVERFNPTKGAKLSTYAAFWIKQCLRRALSHQSRTIRLPNHLTTKLFNLRKAAVGLEQRLGRPPTTDELAQNLETTSARITQLQRVGQSVSSLDASVGADDDSEPLANIVEDIRAENPCALLERKTGEEMVKGLLRKLPEREATILRSRFGLNDNEAETLEKIGQRFGLTRERVRQLEAAALKKLRKMLSKLEQVGAAA